MTNMEWIETNQEGIDMETDKMIERDTQEVLGTLGESVDRIAATAVQLEKAIAWLEDRHAAIAGEVHHVSAEVEVQVPSAIQAARRETGFEVGGRRETDLERRLEEAENQIAELRAQASQAASRYAAPLTATATQDPARNRHHLPCQARSAGSGVDRGWDARCSARWPQPGAADRGQVPAPAGWCAGLVQ